VEQLEITSGLGTPARERRPHVPDRNFLVFPEFRFLFGNEEGKMGRRWTDEDVDLLKRRKK